MNPSPSAEEFFVLQFGFVPMWRCRAPQSILGTGQEPCTGRSWQEQPWDGHAVLSCPGWITSTTSALLSLSQWIISTMGIFKQSKLFMLE